MVEAKAEMEQEAAAVVSMEEKGATLQELREFISGDRTAKAWRVGDVEMGMLACGQIAGQIREVLSVKEVIDGIVQEAVVIHKSLSPGRSHKGTGQ